KLKYLYGSALSSMIKENYVVEVPTVGDRKPRKVSQRVLVEILEARMEEIFQMVNKEICSSGYRTRLNAGIVITGGSALLAHMVDMAEQIFDLPVRVGYPRGIGGRVEEVDSPRCTTAVGLLLYGSQILRSGAKGGSGVREKLKKWVKNIV
ncbi:MAG: cell division protein FtsA, partial [Desulfobulbaceae bacterium]|nr:cell division protein FtsA [Desulfobulbaceae bacterium]